MEPTGRQICRAFHGLVIVKAVLEKIPRSMRWLLLLSLEYVLIIRAAFTKPTLSLVILLGFLSLFLFFLRYTALIIRPVFLMKERKPLK